jgi:hypothetical protein
MKQCPQEPMAWMLECQTMTGGTTWILSWSNSGAGLCNRMVGIEHERALYAAPPAPQRKPLTESQILDLLPDAQHGWTTATYGKWVARAVERAHGINNDATD